MDFKEKVYSAVRKIPKGKVITYKQIALGIGNKNSYRAVGNVLNKNHDKKITCHRVVKSNGEIGGYNRGIANKIKILRKEGVDIKNNKVDLEKYGYRL